MSRPYKHPKTGVYWLRKRVPTDIAALTGRVLITRTLSTKDPEQAKRKHTEVLAELEAEWEQLRLGSLGIESTAKSETRPAPDRQAPFRSITDHQAHQFAKAVHDEWLSAFRENPSEQLFWHPNLYDRMWTNYPLPQTEPLPGVEGIADAVPGRAPIENFQWRSMRTRSISEAERILRENGFVDDPWSIQKTARAVAAAIQRASVTLARIEAGEDEAIPATEAVAPHRANTAPVTKASMDASSPFTAGSLALTQLVELWWKEAKAAGRKVSTYESYRNTIGHLVAFLGHDRAHSVTRQNIIAFKDHRLSNPSPKTGKMVSAKTVKDSDLSGLKVLFGWAITNGLLTENPAVGVTVKLGKPARLRSKSLTDREAEAILRGARAHKLGSEHPKTFAAKRWVPWLSAFTGARVGELAQLRRQDVFESDGIWIIRITPEAGTVKTNEAREVPVHSQVIELGFLQFVEDAGQGHLFLNVETSSESRGALRGLKNRLAEFARTFVADPNVAPNHGWRHRFKTVGMEVGIAPRILDAIQGQAPRTVAETYGEVTLKTMAAEIAKLPSYTLE